MKKFVFALFLTLAGCAHLEPSKHLYAGVAVAYVNGEYSDSELVGVATDLEKCQHGLAAAAANSGAPPVGMTVELACVELVPFKTITGTAAPAAKLPGSTSL